MGVGGGFILVPALILLFGLSAHQAVGTSVFTVMCTGLFASFAYFKQKRIDWPLGFILELITAPGAFMGAITTSYITSRNLELLFACLLLVLAFYMWTERTHFKKVNLSKNSWKRIITDKDGKLFKYEVNLVIIFILSFLAGFSSGFFGIGGGIVKVPALIYSGVPVHIAVATSSFMIIITASSAIMGHLSLGNICFDYLIGLVPGVVFGTQIGAKMAKKAKAKTIRRFFSIFLVLIAICMFLRA